MNHESFSGTLKKTFRDQPNKPESSHASILKGPSPVSKTQNK